MMRDPRPPSRLGAGAVAALALLVGGWAFPCLGEASEVVPAVTISADGARLVGPDGEPLDLRGVNWGWWGCVDPADAELLRSWGGNLIRISFPYSKVTKPGSDELGGDGLALLDSMVGWAEAAGVWFVLCCQETPGGCNTAHHCLGGKNALWRDETYQAQCIRMWETLAARYRGCKWLLAYELMNEPGPPPEFTTAQYRALMVRLVDAIRAVDAERLIVVSPRQWSAIGGLNEEALLPRPRLLYTFHCYDPGNVTMEAGSYPGRVPLEVKWLGNSPEGWGASGDSDWTLLQKTFEAPADATHGQIMLRSDSNAGEAWFDDIALTCDGKPVAPDAIQGFPAERRDTGWKVMRETAGEFTWDDTEGKAAPGCLRIKGTDSYNAWMSQTKLGAEPGATYQLQCWAKTRGATGFTYPSVAWFAHREQEVDRAWLAARLQTAVDFSKRHGVPVWCGEFGCSQSAPDGSGVRWVRDVGELLRGYGIPWCYWNWRETTGRGSMGVWVQDGGKYVMQEPLGAALRDLLTYAPEASPAP